jgi:hypothetical protein
MSGETDDYDARKDSLGSCYAAVVAKPFAGRRHAFLPMAAISSSFGDCTADAQGNRFEHLHRSDLEKPAQLAGNS